MTTSHRADANRSRAGLPADWARTALPSPLGPLTLVIDKLRRLRALYWSDHSARAEAALKRQFLHGEFILNDGIPGTSPQDVLADFFDGDDRLMQIPLVVGGSPFQRSVWRMLLATPAGQPASYTSLAWAIGHPAAVRAVGTANGANPLPIVVPCHRVIAADGTLGGYGGGLERKRWLLDHERGCRRRPHELSTTVAWGLLNFPQNVV